MGRAVVAVVVAGLTLAACFPRARAPVAPLEALKGGLKLLAGDRRIGSLVEAAAEGYERTVSDAAWARRDTTY